MQQTDLAGRLHRMAASIWSRAIISWRGLSWMCRSECEVLTNRRPSLQRQFMVANDLPASMMLVWWGVLIIYRVASHASFFP